MPPFGGAAHRTHPCGTRVLLQLIQQHGGQDQHPEHDHLFVARHPGHVQAVLDHRDDQGADQRAEDAALAAGQAGPAHDHGGDDLQFVQFARVGPAASESRGVHDAASPAIAPHSA